MITFYQNQFVKITWVSYKNFSNCKLKQNKLRFHLKYFDWNIFLLNKVWWIAIYGLKIVKIFETCLVDMTKVNRNIRRKLEKLVSKIMCQFARNHRFLSILIFTIYFFKLYIIYILNLSLTKLIKRSLTKNFMLATMFHCNDWWPTPAQAAFIANWADQVQHASIIYNFFYCQGYTIRRDEGVTKCFAMLRCMILFEPNILLFGSL